MLSISNLEYIVISFMMILKFSYSHKEDDYRTHGNCTSPDRKNECCNNYYYAEDTKSCEKCPRGSFGTNCSEPCPENMYGDFCSEKCNCKSNQQCNYVYGCIDSQGICSNRSSEVICCNNYILRDGNCEELHIKSNGHIYWIIPVVIGVVIFLISICRRFQTSKQRHFVDIPTYQGEINRNIRDNYDHMADIVMAEKGDTVDSRKLVATSSSDALTRVISDEIQDTGVYHTLNLRVFDYEEPIKHVHEQLKRSYSDNSSLYFECPTRLMTSPFDMKTMSNCKRGSSLRQTRSTNDHIYESDEQKLTRKKHFFRENKVSNDVENSEPTFDSFNVNDSTDLEKKNVAPQSKLLLTELSSHLLNLQRH